jgi:thiosulfate/3-mercaptopyruvate sulfurtransferase
MINRSMLQSGITRRGLLVGAGLIAAPFIIRSRPTAVQPLTVPDNRTYPRDDLLISPQALYQRIFVERRPTRILDATDLATYRARHIPGAIHVWWQDTMELNADYYGMVLKPDDGAGNQGRRVRFLERLGIGPEVPVVVSGDTENRAAARVCWFLRFLGAPAMVLDGGRAGWLGAGYALTETVPNVPETTNPPVSPQSNVYMFADDIAAHMSQPGTQLIDLRNSDETAAGRFRGMQIPGAINIPRAELTGRSGLILPPSDLGQVLSLAGVDIGVTLMLIAPTGLDAALPWLALSLMGAKTVITADGGWQQWIDMVGVPLQSTASTGPAHPARMAQAQSGTKG